MTTKPNTDELAMIGATTHQLTKLYLNTHNPVLTHLYWVLILLIFCRTFFLERKTSVHLSRQCRNIGQVLANAYFLPILQMQSYSVCMSFVALSCQNDFYPDEESSSVLNMAERKQQVLIVTGLKTIFFTNICELCDL